MARTPQTPGAPSAQPKPPASISDEATKPTQPDAGAIAPVDLSNMSDVDKDAFIAQLQAQIQEQAERLGWTQENTSAKVIVTQSATVEPPPTGGKVNWRLTESGWEH